MVFQVSAHGVLNPGKGERPARLNDFANCELVANQGIIETTGQQRSILIWQDISNHCQTTNVPM